jgi:hypothetical protein
MLSRSEIEYIKKVNGIRKKMGLALNTDQCKHKSFLLAVSEITNQKTEI